MIETVKAARTTRLTLLANVKSRLDLSQVPEVDAPFEWFLDKASESIAKVLLNRRGIVTARADFRETCPGYGDSFLQLSRKPIAAVSGVIYNSDPITDYLLWDKEAGQLYRKLGWAWTAQAAGWNTYSSHFPRLSHFDPQPGSETPEFQVDYTAGWILPALVPGRITISAAAPDGSFNDSANALPEVLPGDMITVSGFANEANNGKFLVTLRTASKVTVAGNLVTEAAGASVVIDPRNLPEDIEEAAVETVKEWWLGRKVQNTISSESFDGLARTYFRLDTVGGLPQRALGLLKNWL